MTGVCVCVFAGKDIKDMTKWSRKDGGWELHLVSTISEWVTAISTMTYVLTFSPDFRNISLSEPVLHIEDTLIVNQSDSVTHVTT